eukprot:scaffold52427_cov59-Phaeocystis_antarctica.AAC.3
MTPSRRGYTGKPLTNPISEVKDSICAWRVRVGVRVGVGVRVRVRVRVRRLAVGNRREARRPALCAVEPMWKTRQLRPQPAGSPEAPFNARSCLRLPRASARLGQSAAWAALAGHNGP